MTELDIRRCLREKTLSCHADEPNTLVIEELAILQGATRVDIAVLNGCFAGYEIKSPADTLNRLPRQIDLYNQVLDRVTLVVSLNHFGRAHDIVPEWWALAVAEEHTQGIAVVLERPGTQNPDPNPRSIAELLWRDEALKLLAQRQAADGVRSKSRRHVWDRLCQVYSMDELKHLVLEQIRLRRDWPKHRLLP